MSEDGDCCYPIRDTKAMTDHAQMTLEQVAEQLCNHTSAWSISVAAWSTLSPSQKEFYLVMADWVLATITQQAQELDRVTKELNHQTRQRAYEFEASQKQAQQLTASQARCRDMESKLASLREAAIPWLTFRRWANQGCFPDLMQSRLMDVFGEVKPATGRDKWFKEYEEQQAWARTQVNWTR